MNALKSKRHLLSYLCSGFLLLMPLILRAEVLVEAVLAVISSENGEPYRELVYLSDLERYRLFFEPPEDKTPTLNKAAQFIQRRDALIHQKLFEREARRFAIKKPTESEVAARLAGIRQRFQNNTDFEQALNQAGWDLPELKAEIVKALWVEKLIRERIQEFIFISPKAVENYQLNHLDAFIGQEMQVIEAKIIQILRRQKETEKKRAYLNRLKEKVRIEWTFNTEHP